MLRHHPPGSSQASVMKTQSEHCLFFVSTQSLLKNNQYIQWTRVEFTLYQQSFWEEQAICRGNALNLPSLLEQCTSKYFCQKYKLQTMELCACISIAGYYRLHALKSSWQPWPTLHRGHILYVDKLQQGLVMCWFTNIRSVLFHQPAILTHTNTETV